MNVQVHSDRLSQQLAEVEINLLDGVPQGIPLATKLVDYLKKLPGKRIRPQLVLIASEGLGVSGETSIVDAIQMERIHATTLIHDDVIDEAMTRRGQPSVNAQWGNAVAVIFGDLLFSVLVAQAIFDSNEKMKQVLLETVQELVMGEMLQLEWRGRIPPKEIVETIIGYKTASLMRACVAIPSARAKLDQAETDAFSFYGKMLGMSFQAVDDALDYAPPTQGTGKPRLQDISQGRATLPLLLALNADQSKANHVAAVLNEGTSKEMEEISSWVVEVGALEQTLSMSRDWAKKACDSLKNVPTLTNNSRKKLEEFAIGLTYRKS